jgi:hypothetical protein
MNTQIDTYATYCSLYAMAVALIDLCDAERIEAILSAVCSDEYLISEAIGDAYNQ